MRSGFASIIHRFAPLPLRSPIANGELARPIPLCSIIVFTAGILFTGVLAAQAQESVEPDVLPSLAEPPPASAESLPATSTEPLPALPQSLPSAPVEPLPSSAASLPSSEEAFPSTPEPLSSSTNYTTAQTNVVPAPAPAGPYGALNTKNVFPGGIQIESPIIISRLNRRLPLESATSRGAIEAICGWITCPVLFCSSITRMKTHLTS